MDVHEASEEQIAMPGEKTLHFLPVSPCRGGDTTAGRERTDQPNYQVSPAWNWVLVLSMLSSQAP